MTLYSREYDFIYFYITLFKALDPRVAFLLEHAETLVDAGLLTVDDVAKYSNTVSADVVAHCCSEIYSASFAASLLTNTNITTSRAAAILNSARFNVDKAAMVIDSMSLTSAATILNDSNLAVSKAVSILSSSYISASKVYSILSNAGLSADRIQNILFNMPIGSRFIDIVTNEASSVTITSNTSISGANRYYMLSVASGVTLSLDGQPNVIIAKMIVNNGTMDKTVTGASGGGGVCASGGGGQGGGGVIIFCDTFTNIGTIRANGGNGSFGRYPSCSSNGNAGGAGVFYRVGSDSAGTGGGGGTSGGGSGGINGGGGGGAYGYAAGGSGDGSTITTFSTYSDLADDIKKAVADWFIRNVLGKSPSTSKPFPDLKGSGGGSGAATYGPTYYFTGGGGGGGGGHIIVICLTASNIGSITSTGGNGGAGSDSNQNAGGGGGGGGIVYLLYKTALNIGTLTSSGGSGTQGGGNGSGGTAKASAI